MRTDTIEMKSTEEVTARAANGQRLADREQRKDRLKFYNNRKPDLKSTRKPTFS